MQTDKTSLAREQKIGFAKQGHRHMRGNEH